VPHYPESVQRVVEELSALPGLGRRTAERLALHMLYHTPARAKTLSEALRNLVRSRVVCSRCRNVSDADPCWLCADPRRDAKTLCVVEQPEDLAAVEMTGAFDGLYFVLGGHIDLLAGKTDHDLPIAALKRRVTEEGVKEVVIATSPTTEGDATALEIERLLESTGVALTRLARGIPMGTSVAIAAPTILRQALKGRTPLR